MAERHPLATPGSWVELRDPADLRAGDKRAVLRMIQDGSGTSQALDMVDGVMVIAVANWQLPEPLPLPSTDPSVLDRLRIPDYDKLADLMGPATSALFPDTPAATPEQVADEMSPTEPSADS
jgi:hypothetical protein